MKGLANIKEAEKIYYVSTNEYAEIINQASNIDKIDLLRYNLSPVKDFTYSYDVRFEDLPNVVFKVGDKLKSIFDDFPLPWSANALMVRAANDNWVIHIGGQHVGRESKQLEEIIRVIVEGVNAKYGDNKT